MDKLKSHIKRKLRSMAKIRFLFACVFNNATYNISQGKGVLSQTWLHLIFRQPQYVLSADINILLWQTRKMKLRKVVTFLKLLLVSGRIWVGIHFFPSSVLFLPIWYQQHTWEPLASWFTLSSRELGYLISCLIFSSPTITNLHFGRNSEMRGWKK